MKAVRLHERGGPEQLVYEDAPMPELTFGDALICVHEVIDYRQVRFEQVVHDVDVVLDTIGNETRERSWQVLKPTGVLVTLPGPISESEAAAHSKPGGRRGLFFIVEPNREQLSQIAALIDSGAIRPVIAETIPLARAREAFERGAGGHTQGKIVLEVAELERASASQLDS